LPPYKEETKEQTLEESTKEYKKEIIDIEHGAKEELSANNSSKIKETQIESFGKIDKLMKLITKSINSIENAPVQ